MILQDEYLNRRRINLPRIHHSGLGGSLILRVEPESSGIRSRWLVVCANWTEPGNHPGHYNVTITTPTHSSHREMFKPLRSYPSVLSLEYEQFEPFFLDFASSYDSIWAPVGRIEQTLVAWEMFLFCFDDFVAGMTTSMRRLISQTIDPARSFEERYRVYHRVINNMLASGTGPFPTYESEFHRLARKPMTWLGQLVNSKGGVDVAAK